MDQLRIATPRGLQGRPEHFEHAPGWSEEFGASAEALGAPVDAVGFAIGIRLCHGLSIGQVFGFFEGNQGYLIVSEKDLLDNSEPGFGRAVQAGHYG